MRPKNRENTQYKTAYSPQEKVVLKCKPYTRTKASFKEECDINNIMKKYNKTGQLPNLIMKDPMWGDFSNEIEYQEAMNIVVKGQEQFEALDAQTRKKFDHDPAKFLEFASNPENADEMAKMGLIKKEAKERVENARKEKAKKEFNEAVNRETDARTHKAKKGDGENNK